MKPSQEKGSKTLRIGRGPLIALVVSATALGTWLLFDQDHPSEPVPFESVDGTGGVASSPSDTQPVVSRSKFSSRSSCAECHEKEVQLWATSHHARAMAPANGESVLGQSKEPVRARGKEPTATLREQDGRLKMTTEGDGGKKQTFEFAYTFGYEPLQQYLVETERGRLQPARLSWDSRSASEGGQRWFHLYAGEEIPPGDILHWLGPNQNAQGMCGDCHSTNYRRGYDAEKDAFETTWSEIDVSCEACHGPASRHLEWAKLPKVQRGKDTGFDAALIGASASTWLIDSKTGIAEPQQPSALAAASEVDSCAPCHSRRRLLKEDPRPPADLLDLATPALPMPPLYHGDGQILDEVYVWGSFTQSKMYSAGVTCSNCHDPHSGQHLAKGNALCNQCHDQQKYGGESHHQHPATVMGDVTAPSCVDCHMPTVTYMEVDVRHDHGFRVPRPDLTERFERNQLTGTPERPGIPNACQSCHQGRTSEWLALGFARLWPDVSVDTPAEWLAVASSGNPAALRPLLRVARDVAVPEMQRAAALVAASRLAGAVPMPAPGAPPQVGPLEQSLRALEADDVSLVRLGVAEAAVALPMTARVRLLTKLLDDASNAVRVEAMRQLVAEVEPRFRTALDTRLRKMVAEYREAQAPFLDRASVRTELGALAIGLGELGEARRQYKRALELDRTNVPAAVNLADLLRQEEQDEEALQLLSEFLKRVPDASPAWYAKGLALVRAKETDKATRALQKAAELAPANGQYVLTYAVALESQKDVAGAIRVLEQGLTVTPWSAQLHQTRVAYLMRLGDEALIRQALLEWRERYPEDPAALQLSQRLQR